MSGPRWIKQWISDMAALNEQFRNDDGLVDFDALGREEYSFRVALITKKFGKSERAREIYRVAKIAYDSSVENGKKGGRPKKSPQDAPNGNAGDESSDTRNGAASKSPTSCDTFTADGDIREDSQAKPDGSAITRNETRAHDALGLSANLYGGAATREGADVSTTVSRNMRRVPQNEAPAHGFSGGRTAQGTMSRSPEAAAQSGKAYDQETYRVSTDEARQSRQVSATADALVNQTRAGAGAQALESPSSLPSPVRNLPRNKEEVRLFAIDNGLDVDDANDWAEMNLRECHGRDKDGKPIRNWKGAILNYCKAMAAKRETA